MPPKSKILKKVKSLWFNYLASSPDDELEKLSKIKIGEVLGPHLLSDKVAQNPLVDDEPKKLFINFEYFKSSVCIFETADSAKMRSLLEKLARVRQFTAQQFHTCDLNPRPVTKSGEYLRLFNHLDDDVDLCEIDISGYGRFFGFNTESFFYFVAVDAEHRNIH